MLYDATEKLWNDNRTAASQSFRYHGAASRPVKEKCYLESHHNQNPLMFPKHSKASASGWLLAAASGGRDESSHLALKDNLSGPFHDGATHGEERESRACTSAMPFDATESGTIIIMAQSQIPALISSRLSYSIT